MLDTVAMSLREEDELDQLPCHGQTLTGRESFPKQMWQECSEEGGAEVEVLNVHSGEGSLVGWKQETNA